MVRIILGLVAIASLFVFSPERADRTAPALAADVAALARGAAEPQAVDAALARSVMDSARAAVALAAITPTPVTPRRLARVDAARSSLDTLQPPDKRPAWRGTLDGR